MGLSLQVITAAIVLAGQSVSTAMGLSMASLMDPNLGNVPVISQFLLIFSTLIFVGLGGHAMLLGLVVDSFSSMPIGKGLLTAGAWAHFVKWSAMVFLGAVLLALPVMVTMLFINIGIGVVTRAAPSLNIFSLGLPVMIVADFSSWWSPCPAWALALSGFGCKALSKCAANSASFKAVKHHG
jgi:flagellar biosynthetic protein FliR